MANLRTNNLSGEQGQNAYRGSVFSDGEDNSNLAITSNSDFTFGTGVFTAECWILVSAYPPSNVYGIFDTGTGVNSTRFSMVMYPTGKIYIDNNTNLIISDTILSLNSWHHLAFVREGTGSNESKLYINGVLDKSATISANFTNDDILIGKTIDNYEFIGYMSNVRITKGEAVYTANFTPPTSELTADANTVLLCCQDSNDPTQEETGKTITASENLADTDLVKQQPKVIPPYGVDAGNTFGGSIQQSTQGYMYFPTGRTEERGGSRGILAGGHVPSEVSTIDFFNIQSTGNSLTFGDLTDSYGYVSGYASHTRAVFSTNFNTPTILNTLEFITIATQGNSADFGDRTVLVYENGALSNETRGLVGGGYDGGGSGAPSNTETIDFNTIASLGNSTDFGDLTLGRRALSGLASPTRGIFAAGYQQPSTSTKTNVIDFVTIASTGNASNFGDLITARWGTSPASSTTRGVFAGGATPSSQDSIDFITIASTGDASDFGDLTQQSGRGSGTSDSIRGVFKIGYNPSTGQNTQEFVTIASTGNALDFGDSVSKTHSAGMTSNAHGGLS